MSGSIYKITNTVNQKFYIGMTTKNIQERFQKHIQNTKSLDTYLYRAMRKYGVDSFKVELIEETNHANKREIHYINILKPHYNMTEGGTGGDTSNSPNYKLGMSKRDISGKKNPMYGRKRPDTAIFLKEAMDKMIEANKCPVVCEGVKYDSVGEAQQLYIGINIRKRLDNSKYPHFYRLRERTKRK